MEVMARESSPMVKHDIIVNPSSSTSAFLANGRKINASIPTAKRKLDLNRSPSKVATVANETKELWIEGDYDSLPEVDVFYPIERTSAVIVDCFDPREISRRITGCSQKLSIVAKKLDSSDDVRYDDVENVNMFLSKSIRSKLDLSLLQFE